jgi:hypothetical protein
VYEAGLYHTGGWGPVRREPEEPEESDYEDFAEFDF